LRRVAGSSTSNARNLREKLRAIDGVEPLFARAQFHEFALRVPLDANELIERLACRNIVAGVALEEDYPELGHALLTCVTETKTRADIELFAAAMAESLA
jgi:glycine dehydrogenase subunit 1